MTTEPDPAAPAGVVVGVDGSQASAAAPNWAADTAATYRAPLTIVFARPDVEGDIVEAEQEEQLLDRSASAVRQRQPEIVVRALRYPDPPVQAMLAASAAADMLVLGSRGLGGFRGLLMGSTAMQVVPWASCPVVVVHPPRQSNEGSPSIRVGSCSGSTDQNRPMQPPCSRSAMLARSVAWAGSSAC
jgi:nucleotide-binding universal stress UspA family protein